MGAGKPFSSKGSAREIELRGGVVVVIERLLRIRHVLAVVGAILLFHGIAPGQSSIPRRVPGSTDEISVSPASSSVSASQTLQFTATGRLRGVGAWSMAIAAKTAKIDVVWSLSSAVGTISAAGLYTAPATISAAQTVTVKATSVADPTKYASATVTLSPPVTISLTPLAATLTASQTQQLTATVGGASNAAVTWSLSPVVGIISAAGFYTAPALIASSQTVTATAASVADPTKSATATVTLNPPVNVTVTPASVTLTQSQAQSFSAAVTNTSNTAVTWSLSPVVGSITAAGLYTAPVSITGAQNVTVKATSTADPTKSATAAVTLNPPVGVTVSPASVTLTQSQTQSFSASVTNTSNTAVTWSISPLVGSITATGLYTAPASIASSQTVTVKATSVADPTKSVTSSVTLNPPVSVTVSPVSVTLTQSQSQTFSATVTNTGNAAVTWSLSPVVGSITSAGLYTAPPSIASAQTVTVRATSVADPTKSATAAVTLNPPVNVTVSPASVTLTQSQTQTFSATVTNTGITAVTWSISPVVGSITAAGLYAAPASITTSQTVTVKATSVADPTKSASTTVTLTPLVTVSLTPSSISLRPSQNQTFTPTVSGTSNTGVTWSLTPALGSLASSATTAVYVAPSTAPTTQSVTIATTSMADPSKAATALITLLQAVTVSLSPSTVSLAPSGTQQFTATVLGTSNTAVTWSINPPVGTISSAGLYTAPSSILTSQTVTLMARSVADPTKSAGGVVSLQTPPLVSHTYYISSSSGSDSNDGLSSGSAWKSLNNIFNGSFSPGDQILLKAGDEWYGMIYSSLTGAAGNPILLGSYGTGPNPIIYGDYHTATWTAVSGYPGVYVTTIGAGAFLSYVYEGPTHLLSYVNFTTACGGSTCNLNNPTDLTTYLSSFTPGSYGPYAGWISSSNSLWIRTIDGNAPSGVLAFQAAAVFLSGSQYVTIQNLDIRRSETGVYIAGPSNNVTVQNNSIQDTLNIGVYLNGYGASSTNSLVQNNTIIRAGNTALYTYGNRATVFRGNNVSDVTNTILGIAIEADRCGIGLQESTNTLVENNSFSNVRRACMDYFYEIGSTVRYNYCYHTGAVGSPHGTGLSVYYNIFNENGATGINAGNTGASTDLIYNNVFYGTTNYGLMGGNVVSDGGTGAIIFRNNIVYGSGALMERGLKGDESGTNVSSDYNLFYTTGTPTFVNLGTSYYSLAAYQAASGQDAHSVFGNPVFASSTPVAATDFLLQSLSPGVYAGENLLTAGIVNGAQVDYAGVSVPQGPKPNVGAYY